MNLKLAFFALCISLFAITAKSQDINSEKKVDNLKINISSIFDPISSYQISYEHYWKKNFNLEHEIGYVTNFSPTLATDPYILKLNGLRTRHELKYFFQNSKQTRYGVYTSFEILLSKYNITREYLFLVDSAYYQYRGLSRNRFIATYHQKIGYQIQPEKTPFLIDVFVGFGLKYVNQSSEPYDNSGEIIKHMVDGQKYYYFNNIYSDGNNILPTFTFGIKVGMFLN